MVYISEILDNKTLCICHWFHSPYFLFILFFLCSLRIPIYERQFIFLGWGEPEAINSKTGKLFNLKKTTEEKPSKICKLSLFRMFIKIMTSLKILEEKKKEKNQKPSKICKLSLFRMFINIMKSSKILKENEGNFLEEATFYFDAKSLANWYHVILSFCLSLSFSKSSSFFFIAKISATLSGQRRRYVSVTVFTLLISYLSSSFLLAYVSQYVSSNLFF